MRPLYETQRLMRGIRRAALQRGVIAILDLGTSKTACLVLRFDGPPRSQAVDGVGPMAGQSQFKVIGHAVTRSRGVRLGEVDSMAETERAIRTAVQAAQKDAQVRVDHVIVCFSGARPESFGLFGEAEVEGPTVDGWDIGRVLGSCDVPDIGEGREILHAQPVNWSLDHRTGLADPRGQVGERLAADLHLLAVDRAAIGTLLLCLKRCDLECAGIASSAYVSGIASLVEDEQELGAVCIDMGGGSTGLSVFMRKHMIYADSVRMGGEHVTSDISMGLQVPMAMAERIKTLYGGVVATGKDDRELIPIGGDTGDWEHDRRVVSRTELIGIMRPRVEEILEEARSRLDWAGFDQLPSQSIVLTGGGSLIPGLDGLAARILGRKVRLGRPLRVQGLPKAATGAAFSGAVGLTLFAAHPQDEWWDFEIPPDRQSARSFRRAVKWFKDNW